MRMIVCLSAVGLHGACIPIQRGVVEPPSQSHGVGRVR
jgi:hypothetical protein